MPSGLILQWGPIENYYVPGGGDYNVRNISFTIPFPNECVFVGTEHYQNLSGYFSFISKNVTKTGFLLMADTTGVSVSPATSWGAWFAVGY